MSNPIEGFPCGFVVNRADDLLCGYPGETEVLVRADWGLVAVGLCALHKHTFNEYFETRRANHRAKQPTPTNQGEGTRAQDTNHLEPFLADTAA